jgi:DNA-binding MarR family transcriptional regulator
MNDIRKNDGGRRLLRQLLHAAGEIENRLERAVEETGLSLAKLGVLEALAAKGGSLPLGRLADQLACVRSNVTQLVDRLEADGLVCREPDPEDRRITLAVITAEGRRRYEEAIRAREEAERKVMGSLSAERREQLAALLHEIGAGIA